MRTPIYRYPTLRRLLDFVLDKFSFGGRMSKKVYYKITISNFQKHNPSIKRGHKATLISNNFCEDAKLRTVPMTTRWLFLNLVLTCGNSGGESFELSPNQLRDMLECNRSIDGALESLQELQLLTFEKITPFINRIEKKRIEKKRIEVLETSSVPIPEVSDKDKNSLIWEAYRSAYVARHKVEPIRNAKVNAIVAQLRKRLGDEAVAVVQFYLSSNKAYYLSAMHSIDACLKDAESLHVQWQKGHAITNQDVRDYEKRAVMNDTWNAIKEGKI